MARKKVKLAWIANDAARRSTLRKRRRGLIKKVSELSTLCDVEACIVIFSPNEVAPTVWPSEVDARRILVKFRALPEISQKKKMLNQQGFLNQRARKLHDRCRRQEANIRDLEMSILTLEGIDRLSVGGLRIEDLAALDYHLDSRLEAVYEVMNAAAKAEAEAAAKAEAEAAAAAAETVAADPSCKGQEIALVVDETPVNWFQQEVPNVPKPSDQQYMYMDNGSPWIDFSF